MSSVEISGSASMNNFPPPVKSVQTPLKGPCDNGHVASVPAAVTQGSHPCLQSPSVLSALVFLTVGWKLLLVNTQSYFDPPRSSSGEFCDFPG